MRTWFPVALAIVLIITGLAATIGGSIWYTRTQVQHECQALIFIEHSHIQNRQFLTSVEFWANADGC